MRKFIILLVAVVFGVCKAKAEVAVIDLETNKAEKSFFFETGILNKYVGERSGQVYTDGPVIQSTFSVSVPWFDFTVWNSSSLNRKSEKTTGDEIDYTISRSDEIGFVGVEYGASYYDFANLCSGTKDNAVAFYTELSTAELMEKFYHLLGTEMPGKVENYIRCETDISTPGSEVEGGTYLTFGARGTWSQEKSLFDNITMDCCLTHDNGGYGANPGWIFAGKLSAECNKWGWTFSPQFSFVRPVDGKTEPIFGLSAKTEF
jgi:hypothetical protein